MTWTSIFPIIFSLLLGSWCGMMFRYLQARREIRRLEAERDILQSIARNPSLQGVATLQQAGWYAQVAGKALKTLFIGNESTGISYQDKDSDGVPDVFQRRKPLSEILEFEKSSEKHYNDYWVAIELPARRPLKGEYVLSGDLILKCGRDFTPGAKFIIVKSVPGTNLDDLVEISK